MRIVQFAALPAALCAAALLSSTGCSGPEPEPEPEPGIDLEAYLGLTVGRCYEYTTADTQQPAASLGMLIEKIDTKQFALPTYQIAYSTPSRVMEDMVAIDGDKVVLFRRSFENGKQTIYDPPLTVFEAPVRPGARLTSTGAARVRNAAGELISNEDHTLKVDFFQPDSLRLPIGETVTGYKALFTESVTASGAAAGRMEVRTIVPGPEAEGQAKGWVKIEMNFSATDETRDPNIYKLQGVRDLAEGESCPLR